MDIGKQKNHKRTGPGHISCSKIGKFQGEQSGKTRSFAAGITGVQGQGTDGKNVGV